MSAVCSGCKRPLELIHTGAEPMFSGIVCTQCGVTLCMDCLGVPPGAPCPKCAGAVKPAYPDVVAQFAKKGETPAPGQRSEFEQRIDKILDPLVQAHEKSKAAKPKSGCAGIIVFIFVVVSVLVTLAR